MLVRFTTFFFNVTNSVIIAGLAALKHWDSFHFLVNAFKISLVIGWFQMCAYKPFFYRHQRFGFKTVAQDGAKEKSRTSLHPLRVLPNQVVNLSLGFLNSFHQIPICQTLAYQSAVPLMFQAMRISRVSTHTIVRIRPVISLQNFLL